MAKTLFVTDLDGTFLSSDGRVSAESIRLINEAIGNGALFSIATARTPSTVATLMKDIHATVPYIVMTGAAIWDPVTGDFSDSMTMKAETASEILSICRWHHLPTFIYCLDKDKINIYHTGALSTHEQAFISERDGSRYKVFHIPADGESEMPDPLTGVSLFYSVQAASIVEPTYLDIKSSVSCNPIFYQDIYGSDTANLEVFSPDVSKANAIRRLKERCGADRVVVFGDNINDIPMLKAADVAIAVENALPEVKRIADIIIGPNTASSVARFIYEASCS